MLEKIGEWLADEPKGRKNVPYIILYVFLALISGALILNFFIMMSAPIVAQPGSGGVKKFWTGNDLSNFVCRGRV